MDAIKLTKEMLKRRSAINWFRWFAMDDFLLCLKRKGSKSFDTAKGFCFQIQ